MFLLHYLAKAREEKEHNSFDKNHIQPQTMEDPIYIGIEAVK